MITGKQVKAARSLIGWDAQELSDKAGIARETVFKIERGTTNPKPETIAKIVKVFDDHRIEFLDDLGVRYRPEGVDVLNGPKGLETFFDQVYEFLKNHGGLVCVSGVDEEQFAEHHGTDHADGHIKRMKKLVEKRDDIEFRVLLREGDTNFMANSYCTYRWQDSDSFVPTPFYVYGDSLVLITFESDPAPKIMIIKSEAFSAAYKKQFNVAWGASKPALNEEQK